GGIDQIHGDDGFNVDLLGNTQVLAHAVAPYDDERLLAGPVLTVPNVNSSSYPNADQLAVGDDLLHGGADDDIIFGDHGIINVTEPPLPIRPTDYSVIVSIASAVLDTGGDDTIFGDSDEDILIGGANRLSSGVRGGDNIDGGSESDLIFGDNVTLTHRAASDPVRSQD